MRIVLLMLVGMVLSLLMKIALCTSFCSALYLVQFIPSKYSAAIYSVHLIAFILLSIAMSALLMEAFGTS